MTFKADISKFVKKTKAQEGRFLREFSLDLIEEIIKRTPVDTGFLRANWYGQINNPGIKDFNRRDPSGAAALTQISLTLQGVKGGDTVYLQNNTKYGPRLEFGFVGTDSLGRVFNQAPRSFVRNTVAMAEIIAEKVAKRIAR